MNDEYAPTIRIAWQLNPQGGFADAMREFGLRRIAAEIAVSPQTAHNYASGESPIPDAAMLRICNLLGRPTPDATMRQEYDPTSDLRSERVTWRASIRRKRRAQAVADA